MFLNDTSEGDTESSLQFYKLSNSPYSIKQNMYVTHIS